MKLDIKRALKSPFNGNNWFITLTILGIINSLFFVLVENSKENPQLLAIIILMVIQPLGIMISGYIIQFVHNEIKGNYPLLPCWKNNIKSYFRKGFYLIESINNFV
ncbi:MAG: hypothetical protein WCK67_12900 [bacterium]